MLSFSNMQICISRPFQFRSSAVLFFSSIFYMVTHMYPSLPSNTQSYHLFCLLPLIIHPVSRFRVFRRRLRADHSSALALILLLDVHTRFYLLLHPPPTPGLLFPMLTHIQNVFVTTTPEVRCLVPHPFLDIRSL